MMEAFRHIFKTLEIIFFPVVIVHDCMIHV